MKTVICDISALALWNRGLCANATATKMKRLENCATSAGEMPLETLKALGLSTPIHILAPKNTHHHATETVHCHAFKSDIPPKSIYRLTDNVYVASAEFCFYTASLSSQTSFLDLIVLGDELCGLYATIGCPRGGGHGGYGFFNRAPLSTPDKLLDYLGKTGLTNRSKAMRAASRVVARSRSPMETVTEMLLCLPPRHGGYGLPTPLLNVSIKLPRHVVELTGIEKLRPDLFWKDPKVAIEYKGELDHDGESNITKDAVRENILMHTGINVLSITKAQFASVKGMHAIAKQVADLIHRRIYLDHRTQAHISLHAKLCGIAGMRQELWDF